MRPGLLPNNTECILVECETNKQWMPINLTDGKGTLISCPTDVRRVTWRQTSQSPQKIDDLELEHAQNYLLIQTTAAL